MGFKVGQKATNPTKAQLFAAAYIKHKFNATRAALEVFDIDQENPRARNVAGAVGWDYLRKPEVQDIIKERMSRADISPEWIVTELGKVLASSESPKDKLATLDRLAHIIGVQTKPEPQRDRHGPQLHPALQINLGIPAPEPKRSKGELSSGDIIEAKAIVQDAEDDPAT